MVSDERIDWAPTGEIGLGAIPTHSSARRSLSPPAGSPTTCSGRPMQPRRTQQVNYLHSVCTPTMILAPFSPSHESEHHSLSWLGEKGASLVSDGHRVEHADWYCIEHRSQFELRLRDRGWTTLHLVRITQIYNGAQDRSGVRPDPRRSLHRPRSDRHAGAGNRCNRRSIACSANLRRCPTAFELAPPTSTTICRLSGDRKIGL